MAHGSRAPIYDLAIDNQWSTADDEMIEGECWGTAVLDADPTTIRRF